MFNCCSHGTLLHFGLQSSRLNICYYRLEVPGVSGLQFGFSRGLSPGLVDASSPVSLTCSPHVCVSVSSSLLVKTLVTLD